jgi:glycosyltransferase involved in cell wall biosynthesis
MSLNIHTPSSAQEGSNTESSRQLPKVTIGLPVFNGERYLREAMDSLLGQSFRDFELIISDNASTDSTAEIIEEYQAIDSRITYIRQPENIGASANFLFVLRQAETKLFMWASHDDIWAENWLEILTNSILPTDIGVRGEVILTNSSGEIIAKRTLPNYRQSNFIRFFLSNESNFRSHYTYSLFNRGKLMATKIETLTLDYYPDAIFSYCLLEQGDLRSVEGTYIRYRFHDENLGNDYSRKWKGWKKIVFRIHPLRYYIDHIRYSRRTLTKAYIFLLIPVKHVYAQSSFWLRGFREIITGKRVI